FETLVTGIAQLHECPRSVVNLLWLHMRDRCAALHDLEGLTQLSVPAVISPDRPIAKPQYHVGMILDATISGDDGFLATASADGTVMIRRLNSSAAPRVLAAGESAYNVVRFSPDSQFLAAGRDDGTILIFNAAVGSIVAELRDHELPVLRLAWSPDGS